jgi:adenylate cyclase
MPELTDIPIGSAKQSRIAVAFVDIDGFTKLTSQYERQPEVILRLLNVFIPEMMQVVHDYNGAVEKNTGDGIMAYFGTETADDAVTARDAVAAALTMRYVFSHLVLPTLQQLGLPTFDFRISINLGPVLIGRIGFAGTSMLTAVGGTANLASKVLENTPAGCTYIGDLVYRNLPADWKQYASPVTNPAWNFIYLGGDMDGLPYPFYHYHGQWVPSTI